MKKTLLITYFFPPAIGGIENYYLNFCGRLKPEEIVVLAQNQADTSVFDSNLPYHIYRTDFFGGKIPPRWLKLKKEIRQIIKNENIEQIIFGHFHPLTFLGRDFSLPYYLFGHGTDITQIKNYFWQKMIFRRVYSGAQKIIANSNFLAQQIKALIGQNDKVEVIYPGIDFDGLNQPTPDFEARKKALDINENDLVLLSLGRLVPEKNLSAVLRVLPALLNITSRIKYLIVGEGPDLPNLKALVESSALGYKVKFIGAVANTPPAKAFYYQLADLFIVPSLKPEGFGIAYLEAQAVGAPVIASKFGGSSEAVKDNETGILVDPTSQEEIYRALYTLITDSAKRQQMSAAGKIWAKEFSWERQMEKIKEILG